MKAAAHAGWHEFSTDLEGRVPYLYLDSADPEGFVTVGVGNYVEPMTEAMKLPFRHADGRLASPAEIAVVWQRVKNMQVLRHRSLSQRSDRSLTLTDEDIDRLVDTRIRGNEVILRGFFPAWDEWPADAQLAIMSWCWAVGPHSRYPRMFARLREGDFEGAAAECTINPQRGSIVTRNERNRVCLVNAARVVQHGLDPEMLFWPRPLAAEYGPPDPPEAA